LSHLSVLTLIWPAVALEHGAEKLFRIVDK